MGRCVEEVNWFCIIDTRWMSNTSIVHYTRHDRPGRCSDPRQPFSSRGIGYQLGTNSNHLVTVHLRSQSEDKPVCFRGWGKSWQINFLQDLTAWSHKTHFYCFFFRSNLWIWALSFIDNHFGNLLQSREELFCSTCMSFFVFSACNSCVALKLHLVWSLKQLTLSVATCKNG